MPTVTIHQAKTNLSKLIARGAGEEIVIARGKEPVAKLVALAARKPKRVPGRLKGKYYLPDEFSSSRSPKSRERHCCSVTTSSEITGCPLARA